MKSFMISCLGCKVNSYEIEAIKDMLLENGLLQVFTEKDADYIIINTCCVTNTAASKSRQKINSLHLANENAKILVMGCYIQGFKEDLSKLDYVCCFTGTSNRHLLVDYIISNNNSYENYIKDSKDFKEYENIKISSSLEKTRAYLKIQDGCNNFCSYCIIPYVRGPIKSRNKDDVISEAKRLISLGFKEIVLTGIHTGSYGKDLNSYKFSDLVEELLNLDGLYRLRISSIEESEIDDKLIYLLQNNNKLAHHLHIPLQAGSDHILKLMNRKYDQKTFVQNIKSIQEKVPGIAISADIIVGFPDETDDDFNETIRVSKEIGFSKIHVFPFSSRKGTLASKMKDLNGSIKKKRSKQLIEVSNELSLNYNMKFLNSIIDVLVEEEKNGYFYGHTSNFLYVRFKSVTNVKRNDIIKVKINNVFSEYVEGEYYAN